MHSAVPTIVLADDNPEIPGLVARILGDTFDIVASVANGRDLLEAAARLHPDIVVLDIAIPGLSGIDVARLLLTVEVVPIVFLTSHGEAEIVQEALAAGGLGYVLKDCATEDLPAALSAALNVETFISPSLKKGWDLGKSPV